MEMKIFLLMCLTSGLASAEKLDRTYLPPPGSKFSGGSSGDIEVPLEFPKETYLTGRPQLEDGRLINRHPNPTDTAQGLTQKPDGFTYFQNSYSVPKTTTSYAFTQTTTFTPVHDYEGLDQPSGFLNASNGDQQSEYPQNSGQNYQQLSNRGQPNQGSSYDQYQQNQNQQSILASHGSTTQRPQSASSRNPLAYLPPVSSSGYKRRPSSGQVTTGQNIFGYPSGQPQGPKYQDKEQFFSTSGVKHKKFPGNPNSSSTTAAPQYQDENFRMVSNQQRFQSPVSNHQNQNQLPGSSHFVSSTAPEYQDGQQFSTPRLEGQNQLTTPGSVQQNKYFSSSTAPQYPDGQSFTTPGSPPQHYQQKQNKYPGNQFSGNLNFPPSSAATQYQDGQQFTTYAPIKQNQFVVNQNMASTAAPQYLDDQRFTKPGQLQESFAPNQQVSGSRAPSQQNQNQYTGDQNYPSTTVGPHYRDMQQFSTPGSAQQNQFLEGLIDPSTVPPQYQDGQRFMPGESQGGFESRVPSKQNFNQYVENQNYPSSTSAPQYADGGQYTTPGSIQQGSLAPANQNQSPGNQYFPTSTSIRQYPNGEQLTNPASFQKNQYLGNQNNKNIPTTVGPQLQDGQRFTTSRTQQVFEPQVPNQQGPGLQMFVQNGNQQYPSTTMPQYQQTFIPNSESNQQEFVPNQNFNQYSGQPNNYQQFQSTDPPQEIVSKLHPQYGNDSIPTLAGTVSPSPQSGLGSQYYGTTPNASVNYNQGFPAMTTGSGVLGQIRPKRPQAAADRSAEIINYENVLTPEGYSYNYDTSNGIHVDETGTVGDGTRAQGGFSYIGDDGKIYSVFYSADENGFQPKGDHLPTPPPIPEAIQRVIEQANKDKEIGISDDGSYNENKYGYMKYDGPLSQLRKKNKTVTPINGADIPNRYENRFEEQNKKNMITKGEVHKEQAEDIPEESEIFSEQELADDEEVDGINKKESNGRFPTKRPQTVKKLTIQDSRTNRLKGNLPIQMKINENISSFKNRKPSKNNKDNIQGDVLVTDLSENNENSQEVQSFDEEADQVSYRDDPNSRTDFRGINKYLPRPTETNRFYQSDKQHPSVRLDTTKKPSSGVNKLEKFGDHETQVNQDTIYGDVQDFNDEDRIRIPSVNNKFGQKIKGQSKTEQPNTPDNDDELSTYEDDRTEMNESYVSDEIFKSFDDNGTITPSTYLFDKKRLSKPNHPIVGEGYNISKSKNIITAVEDTGYKYIPPQRKFDSERIPKFPSRTAVTEKPKLSSQKSIQTTLRPFITPNVYDNDNESTEEDDDAIDYQRKLYRPVQPSTTKNDKYPGLKQERDRYNENGNLEGEGLDVNKKPTEQYGTTSSPRPFGSTQTTTMPHYEEQDTTGQNIYSEPAISQGSRRPSNKVSYGNNFPNKTVSKAESNAFVSTTPYPSSKKDFGLPGRYQSTVKPINRFSSYNKNGPENDALVKKLETTESRNQVPSTTYRPNYTSIDRTIAPNGPIAVDGFGRPISSTKPSNNNITYRPSYPGSQDSRVPDDISKYRPGKMEDKFRPSVGQFGVTSAPTQGTSEDYEGSTLAPIGENFSGPKQPPRFDPETGYHYK